MNNQMFEYQILLADLHARLVQAREILHGLNHGSHCHDDIVCYCRRDTDEGHELLHQRVLAAMDHPEKYL